MRYMTHDIWHMTHDLWHMTCDTGRMTFYFILLKNYFYLFCPFLSDLVLVLLSAHVERFSSSVYGIFLLLSETRNKHLCLQYMLWRKSHAWIDIQERVIYKYVHSMLPRETSHPTYNQLKARIKQAYLPWLTIQVSRLHSSMKTTYINSDTHNLIYTPKASGVWQLYCHTQT